MAWPGLAGKRVFRPPKNRPAFNGLLSQKTRSREGQEFLAMFYKWTAIRSRNNFSTIFLPIYYYGNQRCIFYRINTKSSLGKQKIQSFKKLVQQREKTDHKATTSPLLSFHKVWCSRETQILLVSTQIKNFFFNSSNIEVCIYRCMK